MCKIFGPTFAPGPQTLFSIESWTQRTQTLARLVADHIALQCRVMSPWSVFFAPFLEFLLAMSAGSVHERPILSFSSRNDATIAHLVQYTESFTRNVSGYKGDLPWHFEYVLAKFLGNSSVHTSSCIFF